MNKIKKAYAVMCKAEEVVAMFGLFAATSVLCIGALSRAFGYPLAMITDIALFLFAWCVFLGADSAYRNYKLVYVEIIIDRLGKKGQRILHGIGFGLIGIFLVIFLYQSSFLVVHSWVRTWAAIPSLSYGWISLSMPVSCFLMLITTCIKFYKHVIKGEIVEKETFEIVADDAQETII